MILRRASRLLRFCVAGALATSAVAQQEYPVRPIRMIVSASPGGTTDLLARAVGERLAAAFRQQVIIDNRSSASGVVAAEATLAAAPDGYTLLTTSIRPAEVNWVIGVKLSTGW